MNRKERRVAAKSDRVPAGAAGMASPLILAETHRRSGRLAEADALCARVLAGEPGHARALHMRGLIARQQGRPADAIAHFTKALSAAPAVAAIHDGLAEAYRATAQPVAAERHYRCVAELQPGPVTLLNLGNALMELQRPADADAVYRAALRFDARLPEAHHGLGTALAALGRRQAGDAFAEAVALRPDFVLAHEALVDACQAADAWEAALRASCQALLHVDTPMLRVQFVDAVMQVSLTAELPGLRDIVRRALVERWTRPQDLARAVCDIVALRQPIDASDELLHTLLELAPVCHPKVERALTGQRRAMLETAASGDEFPPRSLASACVLARQCFINEYAWSCTAAESSHVDALRRAIHAALDRGLVASDTMVAAVALYAPLASLDGAERLLSHPRPRELAAVLTQQVSEPAEESRLRGVIPRATSIEDETSHAVRDQYEVNPYPRWVAMAGATHRVRLGEWLTARFPDAPVAPLPAGKVLEVLVAGCGTGQQALDTVRSLADVRVLAIDLSLASLAYAARMTAALGVPGIEYAQADLLRSAQLGRSFDMIGVGGVLHHLADPWTGWRTLLGLLRPGGVMNVLLYTVRGRGDVARARDWIAARGYPATTEGILRGRHGLMGLDEDWAARLSASPDFHSVSGCRDLLFHVHERAVTLPEVSAFLAGEGVNLLGVEVPASTGRAFEAWCGNDGSVRDLARWDLFEAEHPRCFAGMLNLWVQSPTSGAPAG